MRQFIMLFIWDMIMLFGGHELNSNTIIPNTNVLIPNNIIILWRACHKFVILKKNNSLRLLISENRPYYEVFFH